MALFDFLSTRRVLEIEAPEPNTPIEEVEFLVTVRDLSLGIDPK